MTLRCSRYYRFYFSSIIYSLLLTLSNKEGWLVIIWWRCLYYPWRFSLHQQSFAVIPLEGGTGNCQNYSAPTILFPREKSNFLSRELRERQGMNNDCWLYRTRISLGVHYAQFYQDIYFLCQGAIYAGNTIAEIWERSIRELNLERYHSQLFFQVMIDHDTCNSFSKGAFQRKVKLIVTDESLQLGHFEAPSLRRFYRWEIGRRYNLLSLCVVPRIWDIYT